METKKYLSQPYSDEFLAKLKSQIDWYYSYYYPEQKVVTNEIFFWDLAEDINQYCKKSKGLNKDVVSARYLRDLQYDYDKKETKIIERVEAIKEYLDWLEKNKFQKKRYNRQRKEIKHDDDTAGVQRLTEVENLVPLEIAVESTEPNSKIILPNDVGEHASDSNNTSDVIESNRLATDGVENKIPEEKSNRTTIAISVFVCVLVIAAGIINFICNDGSKSNLTRLPIKNTNLGIVITNFNKTDDDDFSDHVCNLLGSDLKDVDTIRPQRLPKFINISNLNFKDTIVQSFEDLSFNHGMLLFGKRSPVTKLLDCNLYLYNWHSLDSVFKNNSIIYIQNPDLINFEMDNQAKVVAKFILGLIYYHTSDIGRSNKAFQEALDLNNNQDNKKFMGYCYLFIANNSYRTKNYKDAIDIYKKGLSCDSFNAYTHFNLAAAILNFDSSKANAEYTTAHTLENHLVNPLDVASNPSKKTPKQNFVLAEKEQTPPLKMNIPVHKDVLKYRSIPTEQDPKINAILGSNLGRPINDQTVKWIIASICQGADPNIMNKETKLTALHIAAIRNDTILAKSILKYEGVNVNVKDSFRGATPLWYAAKQNSYRVAQLLLEYGGVRVDAFEKHTVSSDRHYSTALDAATDPALIDLLMQYNAHKFEELYGR